MKNTLPFDLNLAIQHWRESLAQSPAFRDENLGELESHLRDSVDTLQTRGLSAEEAFLIAARRLGRIESLDQEYCKVNARSVWRMRLFWMIAGMLLLRIGGDLFKVVGDGALLVGCWLTSNASLLALIGVAGECVVIALSIGLLGCAMSGRMETNGWADRALTHRPKLAFAILLGSMLGMKLAAGTMQLVVVRSMGIDAIAQVSLVLMMAHTLWAFLLVVTLVVTAWRILRRKEDGICRAGVMPMFALIALFIPGATASASDETPAGISAVAVTNTAGASMDKAMKLWGGNKKTEAVETFMAVDFSQRPLFPSGNVLNYSEAQFIALPDAAREKLGKPMLEDIRVIKEIARQVKQSATQAQAAGDKAKADQYLSQLKRCGEALNQPDSLALLKLVGKALTKMAADTPAAAK